MVSFSTRLVFALALIGGFNCKLAAAQLPSNDSPPECYELRIYKIFDFEKQQIAEKHLKDALLPALNRQGIDRIGVFVNQSDENDHSLYMLIPFSNIEKFVDLNASLATDQVFQTTSTEYFARELADPVFNRIESRLMKAFVGMPKIELPGNALNNDHRIFELRLYESHTEDHARRKVQMFNEGEIQVMREAKLGPVFFGESLIGPDVPNLIYMLSAANEEEHAEHWKSFLAHPEWLRMKDLPEYKDTVSKIQKWILKPTSYSQL